MDISKIREAGTRIESGAWVDKIPVAGVGDLALKVRGADNSDAKRLRDELVRGLPAETPHPLPADVMERLNTQILAQTVLQDWNLTDGDAKVPPSVETFASVLSDPVIGPLMREAVSWASATVATAGKQSLEADVKN